MLLLKTRIFISSADKQREKGGDNETEAETMLTSVVKWGMSLINYSLLVSFLLAYEIILISYVPKTKVCILILGLSLDPAFLQSTDFPLLSSHKRHSLP